MTQTKDTFYDCSLSLPCQAAILPERLADGDGELAALNRDAMHEDFRTCHACGARYRVPESPNRHHDCGCNQGGGSTQARPAVLLNEDWLDGAAPASWTADLLRLIRRTPNIDWLLSSTQGNNFADRLADAEAALSGDMTAGMANEWLSGLPPRNVWLGTTIATQREADRNLTALLRLPAVIRFAWLRPCAEWVKLTDIYRFSAGAAIAYNALSGRNNNGFNPISPRPQGARLHWVVAGGTKEQPASPQKIDFQRQRCADFNTPFFFTGWGESVPQGETQGLLHGVPARQRPLPYTVLCEYLALTRGHEGGE